jgi:hypothetical protein
MREWIEGMTPGSVEVDGVAAIALSFTKCQGDMNDT